jgi:hypothetical protein
MVSLQRQFPDNGKKMDETSTYPNGQAWILLGAIECVRRNSMTLLPGECAIRVRSQAASMARPVSVGEHRLDFR